VKVLLDHNLSPRIARALQALFVGQHEVVALRDKFRPDVADLTWIEELSRDGRWVVLSGDRRITRNRAELRAFRQSRLVGMFFSPGLNKAPVVKQAERLLALWASIEKVAETVEGGAMFELPMTSVRLKQL
jgi:hypothetical protein